MEDSTQEFLAHLESLQEAFEVHVTQARTLASRLSRQPLRAAAYSEVTNGEAQVAEVKAAPPNLADARHVLASVLSAASYEALSDLITEPLSPKHPMAVPKPLGMPPALESCSPLRFQEKPAAAMVPNSQASPLQKMRSPVLASELGEAPRCGMPGTMLEPLPVAQVAQHCEAAAKLFLAASPKQSPKQSPRSPKFRIGHRAVRIETDNLPGVIGSDLPERHLSKDSQESQDGSADRLKRDATGLDKAREDFLQDVKNGHLDLDESQEFLSEASTQEASPPSRSGTPSCGTPNGKLRPGLRLKSSISLNTVGSGAGTERMRKAVTKVKVLNQMQRIMQEPPAPQSAVGRIFMPLTEILTGPSSQAKSGAPPVFADAEDLKNRLRDVVSSGKGGGGNQQHAAYKTKGFAQKVCRDRRFDMAALGMVIFSSLWITVDTDFNHAPNLSESHWGFQVVAHFMCLFFTTELCLRWCAFRSTKDALTDISFTFDGFLVALMVIETWVATFLLFVTGWNAGANVRAFVILRMLRLFRALRLARVLRSCPELLVIVRGVGIALRAISVVLALIAFIIYMGGIVFRILAEGFPVGEKRFSTVFQSMGTLLIECTLAGHKCGPVMYEANESSFPLAFLVFAFVLVANITMMGVLAGLLVQTVRTTAEVEKEEGAVRHVSESIDGVWDRITAFDMDGDGLISEKEIGPMLLDETFARTLLSVGVDLESFFDMSQFIFKQYGGSLAKKDFKKIILDLRGREQAKVKHHIETRKYVHNWLQEIPGDVLHSMAKSTSSQNVVKQHISSLNDDKPASTVKKRHVTPVRIQDIRRASIDSGRKFSKEVAATGGVAAGVESTALMLR